jgi:hypothetical protein
MAPIIFVALVGDGTPCWRPIHGIHLRDDDYQIISEVPPDERWEFTTGDHVRCRKQTFADGKKGWVAYEKLAA